MVDSSPEPFVGRTQELTWLDRLCREQRPVRVAFLHGPGGIGKSTLVRRWGERAAARGVTVSWVDATRLPVGGQGMLRVLAGSLGVDGDRPQALGEALVRDRRPRALVIDGMEALGDREGWIRDVLLPELPADMPVVMVGRNEPGIAWAEPGWAELLTIRRLEPLSAGDAEAYLAVRGVPVGRRSDLLDVARGHPLALAIGAESTCKDPTRPFRLGDDLDALDRLLEDLVREAPSERHRATLEAACLLDHVTEDVLTAIIGEAAAYTFDWLAGLSFVSREARGLVVHDLVRECVGIRLAARDRARYRLLVARARDHFFTTPAVSEDAQAAVVANLVCLLSHVMPLEGLLHDTRPFAPLTRVPCVPAAQIDASTWSTLEDIVEAHEGAGSVRWMRWWRERSTVRLLRDEGGEVAGFSMAILLDETAPEGAAEDPVFSAIVPVVQRTLAQGRGVSLVRLWMSRDGHHGESRWLGPIVHGFLDHADDAPRVGLIAAPMDVARYGAALGRSVLSVFPGSEHAVAGRREDWTGFELGDDSLFQWVLRQHGQLLQVVGSGGVPDNVAPPDFRRQVMNALRVLGDPAALGASPLADLPAVQRRCTNGAVRDTAQALKTVLIEQHGMFERSRRDQTVRDVMTLTYLSPGGTQREVAEALGMSFGTYRRYLTEGVHRLADALWKDEEERS